MATRGKISLWTAFWLVVPFGILVTFWYLCVKPIYVEEQFSELASSTWMFHPHVLDWFTKPFSLYRMDYPEWNLLYRSFIRPTECLHYYILSLIFSSNFSAYLLANYFYQAATCSLTYYIAAQILRLDSRIAALLAFLVFVSPAYGQQQSFLISFAVDPMAGFLILASIAFFLRKRFIAAWIFIALAVGAKEPAWPIPFAMASVILFLVTKPRMKRFVISLLYLIPVIIVILLRAYAFGWVGAFTSDEGGAPSTGIATSIFTRLFQGLEKWPFGVLVHSQQYDPAILEAFRILGSSIDILVWASLIIFFARIIYHQVYVRRSSIAQIKKYCAAALSRYSYELKATIVLAAGSLVFPLRFTGDPRYGAPTYPLIFLTLGIILSHKCATATKAIAWCLLGSIGVYGLTLRISDATHGVQVFRSEWQLVAGYRKAILDAGSHPMFIVDDATGGEINSDAIKKFYGADTKVVRINDIYKERDCLLMPDNGELPLHIDVTARRIAENAILVKSVMTGCGGHNFLGVPRLPPGTLERSDLGFKMKYMLDPRSSPQPVSGSPRILEVVLENAPEDSIIIAPDLAERTYRRIPIGQ